MSNTKFKVGDRVCCSVYGPGTIQAVASDGGYKVRYDLHKIGGMYGDGLYWSNNGTLTLIKAAPVAEPKFKKGDIVTWGSVGYHWEFVGEIDGEIVVRYPRKAATGEHRFAGTQVLVQPVSYFSNLRLVPRTRNVKVQVEIVQGGNGKLIAYANSEDEGFLGERPTMKGSVGRSIVEVEVEL